MTANSRLLFVYGTLQRKGKWHAELKRASAVKFLGPARINGKLFRLADEDYPAAVPTRESDRFVHGQLFTMSDPEKTLSHLDEFEEVNEGLFRREMVDVWFGDGRKSAWAYFYARPLRKALLLGDGRYRPVRELVRRERPRGVLPAKIKTHNRG
jgi:gamma-glutamylcyclotransferase (GGCT)/AIG2-like uncharacterized protein YtfP